MNDDRMPLGADDQDSLPPRLRDELERLSPAVRVPPSLDSAILSRAKAEYARRVRFRPVIRWVSVAAAMAAVVAIVLTVRMGLVSRVQPLAKVEPHDKPIVAPPSNGAVPRPVQGDINGDGKVDMLDAYILARRIKAGATRQPQWDVNGDGAVDQRDVDWIANASVNLGTGAATGGGALR